MQIGAQFFTLRDHCKDLDSFADSLARVAAIGYKNVQISGTCGYDPAWLKEQLDKNGLACVLTHIAGDELQGDIHQVAQNHRVFGCQRIGLGYFPFNEEKEKGGFADFFHLYPPVAKAIKEEGLYFMYHHHDHEFQKREGKRIIEYIAEGFAPDELGFTLDTFWVQAGGGDPAAWIDRLAGRLPCIHLKDFAYGKKMAVVGEGNINFDRVFAAAEAAGTEYMLVEQDDCNGEDPFDCLARSYAYLRSRGFE